MVLTHGFIMTSNLCLSTEKLKMKVALTLLTAPIHESRCGAWTIFKYTHVVL